MNYIGQDELTELMGIGELGEVRQGPDGDLYQWVHGIDGLGNPFGFWKKIKRFAKRAVKRAVRPVANVVKKATQFIRKPWCIPLQAVPRSVKGIAKRVCGVVGKLSPLAHVPVVGSYYRGAAKLCKIAKGCGIAGLEDGLGDGTLALYQGLTGSDGFYGFGEDEVLYGLGQEDLTEIMGIGSLGEVRQGPDGEHYQWVEGIDGLGRRKRFWHCQRCLSIKKRLAQSKRRMNLRPPSIPSLPQAKPTAVNSLGDLYQTSDGQMYEMAGLEDDSDLYGLAQDDELEGFAQDDDLNGFADEDLEGVGQDEDLYGLGQDDDLYGFEDDDELYGLEDDLEDLNGYVHTQDGVNGLEAYIPDKPPKDHMFVKPAQTPEIWKSLW